MKKALLVLLALALTFAFAACGDTAVDDQTAADEQDASEAQNAEATYKLQLSHTNNTMHPYHFGSEKFKELVEERTNGDVTIEIFPANQLGSPADALQGVQLGTIDFCVVSTAYVINYAPKYAVLDLPYLFPDREAAFEKVNTIGLTLDPELESKGIDMLAVFDGGYRLVFNSKKPIEKVADCAGMQIRSLDSKVYLDMFQSWGMLPLSMSWSEVYTSLQQGVVDAADTGISSIYSEKFYEVAPYISLTNHTITFMPLMASAKTMKSLPEEYQEIIREAAIEAAQYEFESIMKMDEESKQGLIDAGATITEVDIEEFKAACSSIWDEFAENNGQDLIDLFAK